jgi:hypothetical protein
MSGETEREPSGWTTDTVHSQTIALMDERNKRFDSEVRWIRDHVADIDRAHRDLMEAMDRRWEERLQEKDNRDQQRFDAQQKAVTDAMLSAEKAVQSALTAANTAVGKAEIANEKRLDSVNEFRQTLTDQASTLMPRGETQVALGSITEKIAELALRISRTDGSADGKRIERVEAQQSQSYLIGAVGVILGAVVGVAGLILSFLR